MSSRRGAVRVNPVTGKIEKYEPTEGPDGVTRHRDGCLVVDERYINAAREIGLGGEQGTFYCFPTKSLIPVLTVSHDVIYRNVWTYEGSDTHECWRYPYWIVNRA